jgi:hypothetical protein
MEPYFCFQCQETVDGQPGMPGMPAATQCPICCSETLPVPRATSQRDTLRDEADKVAFDKLSKQMEDTLTTFLKKLDVVSPDVCNLARKWCKELVLQLVKKSGTAWSAHGPPDKVIPMCAAYAIYVASEHCEYYISRSYICSMTGKDLTAGKNRKGAKNTGDILFRTIIPNHIQELISKVDAQKAVASRILRRIEEVQPPHIFSAVRAKLSDQEIEEIAWRGGGGEVRNLDACTEKVLQHVHGMKGAPILP